MGNAVTVVDGNDISDWPNKLTSLIKRKNIPEKHKIIEVYNQHFSWQSQEAVFLKLVADSVG